MNRSAIARGISLFVALIALLLATGKVAFAHADYVSSVPPANGSVATAPQKVVVVFSQELKPEGNTIRVTDARGNVVDGGDTALDRSDPDRKTIAVSLKSGLGDGAYKVEWTNASTDGHSESGSFTFTVGAAAASAPAALPRTGGSEASLPFGLLAALALLTSGWFALRRVARS